MIQKTFLTFALVAVAVAANAQIALDKGSNAAYSDGWTVGDNGGYGFGAWTTAGGNTFGGSVGITNSPILGGDSFTIASGPGVYSTGEAIRPFGAALGIGDTFSLDFAQSDLASPQGDGSFGIVLRNASGQEMTSVFGYFYNQYGLTPTYSLFASGAAGNADTGLDYRTAAGIHAAFTVDSATGFTVRVGAIGSSSVMTSSGTFKNSGPITGLRLFSYEASPNSPLVVNNLKVAAVPEPATYAALALGLAALRRRRR